MKTKKTRGDENCQSKDIDNKTQNEDKKNKGWWELSIQRYRQQDTEWRQKQQKQHKN
jgi:hypothetical protein